MYSINAVYEGTVFKPTQPVPVKEDYEVVINFIKPIKKEQSKGTQSKRPRSEIIGLLKDKVWMSDDFNAPIDEMKEYME